MLTRLAGNTACLTSTTEMSQRLTRHITGWSCQSISWLVQTPKTKHNKKPSYR